jgi:hypothetical protein
MALINDAAQPPAATNGALSSPILQAAEQKIEAGLDPAVKPNYDKIVVAGMAAGLQGGKDGILASLAKSDDPVRDAAKGAVSLVLILRRDAKGVMPVKAMVPAAMTLMLHALDFIARTGTPIAEPELDRATRIFANDVLAAFHITAPMIQRATEAVKTVTQDPAKMEMIHRKLGSVVAPGASVATPMPSA